MAIFSRYSKVLETDGSAMRVRTALGLINQALDEILAEQEGEYDAETRWALTWFEQYGNNEGKFGDAETLSRAKDTAVNALEEAGIVKARAGKVQLVPRDALSPPPFLDMGEGKGGGAASHLTIWQLTQHLIRALETGGGAHHPARRVAGGGGQGPRLPALRYLRSQGLVAGGARLQHDRQVMAGAE